MRVSHPTVMRHANVMSSSSRVVILCLALLPAWVTAQTVQELPSARKYLAAGVYEEAGQLHFERPSGQVREPLGEWRVMGSPVGQFIGLTRGEGREVRIMDRSGRQVGSATIPPPSVGIVTDAGIVAIPKALHEPIVPHEISFYSLDGKLLKEVREPNLLLVKSWVEPDGRFITANLGPDKPQRTILVYGPDGRATWRYTWTATGEPDPGLPDVVVTPDNRRLVLLQPRLTTGAPGMLRLETDLIVLAPRNQVLASHHLPNLYKLITSSDSRRVAAVGQNTIVMLDAESGKLTWRKDEDIDFVVPGGLRFDADGQLLVISTKRDQAAGASRLSIRKLRLDDGEGERADLGSGSLEQTPTVFAIESGPAGAKRITLHDRIVEVPASAWQAP